MQLTHHVKQQASETSRNKTKEITYFLNFSSIRSDPLQWIIKNASQNKGKTKLFDVCGTRCVGRIDSLDLFEGILIYIV